MMVEKQVMRTLGKESAPQFNAYLTACCLFDKYGTSPKGIIDPTRPAGGRTDDGYVTDEAGNVLFHRNASQSKMSITLMP